MNRIYYPQQGDYLYVWVLFRTTPDGSVIEAMFTHKVQAEAALRVYREMFREDNYHLRECRTTPHDNLV